VAGLGRLQAKLTFAQQELAKHKKSMTGCERLVKSKQALVDEELRIGDLEKSAEQFEVEMKGDDVLDEILRKFNEQVPELSKAARDAQRTCDMCSNGAPVTVKEELQQLSERAKTVQTRIAAISAATKPQRERVLAQMYAEDGEKKVNEMEDGLENISNAETPFLKGNEDLPLEEALSLLETAEKAADFVQSAIASTRTFIASKNLEVKRFGGTTGKEPLEEFGKLTERINTIAGRLSTFRKESEDRRRNTSIRDAVARMDKAEAEVKKMEEAVAPLAPASGDDSKNIENLSAEEASEHCKKLSAVEKGAQEKLDSARSLVESLRRNSRDKLTSDQSQTLTGLTKRLSEAQVEMAKAKKIAGEYEQAFVAKKLVGDAEVMLKEMQEEIDSAEKACEPLLVDGGEQFLVAASMQTLVDALSEHLAESNQTTEILFKEMTGGDSCASAADKEKLNTWIEALPTTYSNEALSFPAERRIAMCASLLKNDELIYKDFQTIFEKKYLCVASVSATSGLSISAGKTVCKIEVGNVVCGLSEPKKDEESGMLRVEVKLQDDKQGFVTLTGNQGVKYLQAASPFANYIRGLNKTFEETRTKVSKVASYLKSKALELSKCAKGPLQEAKQELTKLRPKAVAGQTKLDGLSHKINEAKVSHTKKVTAERNAHKEAKLQKAADAALAVVAEKIDVVENYFASLEKTGGSLPKADAIELHSFDAPLTVYDQLEELAKQVKQAVDDARQSLKEQQEQVKKEAPGALAKTKTEFVKMKVRTDQVERKSKQVVDWAKASCSAIANARLGEAAQALRAELISKKLEPDELFNKLVEKGEETISEASFCAHLMTVDALKELRSEHAKLLFRHVQPGGIGRRRFCGMVQQYHVIVRAIALTNEFEISKSKTLRKAEEGEIVEVLEGPSKDEKVGLLRIKARSLSDGIVGWITVKGNHGTPFLQEVEKPFYACNTEMSLEKDFEGSSAVRQLKEDEVVELLEGPRKEEVPDALRAKVKATSDGETGWLTIKDPRGTIFAEAKSNYYTVISSVALTDTMDIKNCSVVRKLAAGELLITEGEPCVDKDSNITRLQGKSSKDGKEGWITVKGNAGTVYAAPSQKHYAVVKPVPLHDQFKSIAAKSKRLLDEGEAVEIIEGPRTETMEPAVRVKGRALADGAVGWIALRPDSVRAWTAYYKCTEGTGMHKTAAKEDEEVIRKLAVGEVVELLEGPKSFGEGDDKRICMRGRAEKDGAVGWVTLRDEKGKSLFEN